MPILTEKVREHLEEVETAISMHMTIEEALQEVRRRGAKQQIIYFYAIDQEKKLQGVVSTRQLLLSDPKQPIESVMLKDVIHIDEEKSMKEAMDLFSQYPLLALPVVDREGVLKGAIDVHKMLDEKLNFQNFNHRNEIFQLIGMSLEDQQKSSLLKSYRLRMPWLLCNVFSGLICAVISRIYEAALAKCLLLAFFIPLVLTLSESSSMQSMTQSLQFLRRPRFSWKSALKGAQREWELIWLLAISSGALVGSISLLWQEGVLASLTIGVGIVFSVALSALFGMSIPIFLHKMRLDPKVAAGPVVLMIADMLTTALYLSLATWWLL